MKLLVVIATAVLGLISSSLQQAEICPGTNCNPLEADIMRLIIANFDFNCIYTKYLANVTKCLCERVGPCIGTHFNNCINQVVTDKVACKDCNYIDLYIQITKSKDFNCFQADLLLKYRECVCQGRGDRCPGNIHNDCFKKVFVQ